MLCVSVLIMCCYVVVRCIHCVIGFLVCCVVFFFKQKTAYEMRISDWSSDVCSSDLRELQRRVDEARLAIGRERNRPALTNANAESLVAQSFRDSLSTKIGRASCRERVCQYV